MPQPSNPRPLSLAVVAGFALVLSACMGALPPERFSGESPPMRPEAFFAGETRSFGVLETPGGAPSRVFRVEGHGAALPDGSFRLEQAVAFEGQPPRRRTWILHAQGEHGYRASLTDASGEVTGEAYGNLFHLRYPLKGVPTGRMEQWLYLQPDGRTVLNEGVVRIAGVTVARLSERIGRTDPPSS